MKCAIITPVDPTLRQSDIDDCTASVNDAIAHSIGPFSEILHLVVDCEPGEARAAARNAGIAKAMAAGVEWILFIEPEDLVVPSVFESFETIISENPALEAIWGAFCDMGAGEPELRDGQISECTERKYMLAKHPYQSMTLGCFVRTEAAAATLFDEAILEADDVAFCHALWASYSCAKKPELLRITRLPVTEEGRIEFNARKAAASEIWKRSLRETPVFRTVIYGDQKAQMRITNPDDLIQNSYIFGEFFEYGSLQKLSALVKADEPRILEVGANIGNHVVWYAQHLNASKIYPVEPNPDAISLLDDNIAANGLTDIIDRRGIGYGVGAEAGHFDLGIDQPNNLGATSLAPSHGGQIEVRTIDELMGDEHVDFIKIDAEGMEMDVLAGAEALINRCKPVLWVEVMRENTMAFMQKWCRKMGYRIADKEQARNATDFFVVPR